MDDATVISIGELIYFQARGQFGCCVVIRIIYLFFFLLELSVCLVVKMQMYDLGLQVMTLGLIVELSSRSLYIDDQMQQETPGDHIRHDVEHHTEQKW